MCFGTSDLWVDVFKLQQLSARPPTPHLSLTCKPGELSADNPELCNSILSPTITSSCLLIVSSSSLLIYIAAFHTHIISSLASSSSSSPLNKSSRLLTWDTFPNIDTSRHLPSISLHTVMWLRTNGCFQFDATCWDSQQRDRQAGGETGKETGRERDRFIVVTLCRSQLKKWNVSSF